MIFPLSHVDHVGNVLSAESCRYVANELSAESCRSCG